MFNRPMHVTRAVAYAVQSMVELALAPQNRPVPCRTLAKGSAMPKRYLLQILRDLVTKGILESVPGVSGGYQLSKRADSITLFDIVDAVDGPIEPRVPHDAGLSSSVREQLLVQMTKVSATFQQQLRSVTVAELAKHPISDCPHRTDGTCAP